MEGVTRSFGQREWERSEGEVVDGGLGGILTGGWEREVTAGKDSNEDAEGGVRCEK